MSNDMQKVNDTKFRTIKPKCKCPDYFIKPKPMEEIDSLDKLISMANTFGIIVFSIGKDKYRIEKNPHLKKSKI
jgi:hypothetical protein